MVDVIGDIVAPSELILPDLTSGQVPNTSGAALYISGAKLCFSASGGTEETVTSS